MRSLLAAALTVTFISVASIAEAQTGWTGTMTTISTPAANNQDTFRPKVAVQPNGNAYAVWNNVGGGPDITVVEAARYVAATDSWDVPVRLAGPGYFALPDVAVDPFGNAFFLVARILYPRAEFQVVRYAPASGTMTTTTLSSQALVTNSWGVAADATGNAMVVWGEVTGIHAARYDHASATWGSPVRISVEGGFHPQLAIDGLNHVTAVWLRGQPPEDPPYVIQAARFDSLSLTWSPANDLSEPNNGFAGLISVAADAVGNVTALWTRFNGTHSIAQAARFVKAAGTWSSVTDLSAPEVDAYDPIVAADPAGNVVGLWHHCTGEDGPCIAQTTRFDARSASWSSVLDFTCSTGSTYGTALQMDATGNGYCALGLQTNWRRCSYRRAPLYSGD